VIHLILGGAKSGKSDFALAEAGAGSRDRVFVATAEALDAEMTARIEAHRKRRGPGWRTVEAPLDLEAALGREDKAGRTLVVDCVTVWLSNLMTRAGLDPEAALDRAEKLAGLLPDLAADVIVVANEVGWGLVPAFDLSRAWRDLAGRTNQLLAAVADRVTLVVAGRPLNLK
jgi:adenosylcobinamide kinase/adenosylcobinamide-phosphate guanylyltransferase